MPGGQCRAQGGCLRSGLLRLGRCQTPDGRQRPTVRLPGLAAERLGGVEVTQQRAAANHEVLRPTHSTCRGGAAHEEPFRGVVQGVR